jgi:hypothetical protein
MAGPEIAGLKNPGLAGDVQFDTVIYGSPPLAYSALLSQFAIYNAPDPAYVTGRTPRQGAFPTHGICTRQSQPNRKLHARILVSVPIAGVAWDHRSND